MSHHTHSGEDARDADRPDIEICPVSGLPIKSWPRWTDLELTDNYCATFKLIGEVILLTSLRGNSGKRGMAEFLAARDRFLEFAQLTHRRHVELKDHSGVTGIVTKESRQQFIDYMKTERNQERLLGYWGFNANNFVKWAYNFGKRIYATTFPVEIVDCYEDALRAALAVLEQDPPTASDSNTIRVTRPEWCFERKDFRAQIGTIGGDILFTETRGVLRAAYVEEFADLYRSVLAQMTMPDGHYYRIADWSRLENSPWRARVRYAEALRRMHRQYPCKLIVLVGVKALIRTMLRASGHIVRVPIVLTQTFDGALAAVARHKHFGRVAARPRRWFQFWNKKSYSDQQIRSYVKDLQDFMIGLDWDTQAVLADGRITPAHPFMPLYESMALIKQDIEEALRESRKTEELRMEKEVAEIASQTKSQFLMNMSHEIRTPLNGIIGFAEIIGRREDPELAAAHAQRIVSEGRKLLELINQLLDLNKIEAGRLEIESRPFSLEHLLTDTMEAFGTLARRKGLDCRLCLKENVPNAVAGDALRIREVIQNLVGNAIKFTEEGSVILTVDVRENRNQTAMLLLQVDDTGIGIPAQKLDTIFEHFEQVDGSMTRSHGGTGLGTAIAKQLVELMGGTIGVRSVVGRGSTFWFTLPVKILPALTPTEELNPYWNLSRVQGPCATSSCIGRILVAEDYPINQDVIRHHLEGAGHSVTIMEDGASAVAAYGRQAFDLILMDLQMPVMDGFQATRAIRAKDETVPIVALTASADSATREDCYAVGMNDILIKPISRDTFLAVVDKWLQAHGVTTGEPPASLEPAPAEEAAPESCETIDYARALDEFGGDEELLGTLIHQFLEDVEQRRQNLRKALCAADLETLRADAHKIKGGAANLTALPLSRAAANLEQAAKAGGEGDLDALFHAVEAEAERLRKASRRLDSAA